MRPRPEQLLDYREFPVLYVDDEPENLRIFELTFRREFAIRTARGGEEALRVINEQPVSLVLTDHRMPGMTGVEFLARAAELDPKTVRMLVTAYGDVETLQNAINNGSIYRFIPKPWTPEDMRVALRRGIEVYALDREREQLLRELTLLNRIAKSIGQELEIDRLLDLLLETLTGELGFDGAGILLFDEADGSLRWGRIAPSEDPGVDARLREIRIAESGAPGFLDRLRRGEAQLLTIDQALALDRPIRSWVTEVAAEETLVVPLVGKTRVIGALAVDNRRGGRSFDADDGTLLEGLAQQAVVAIENARLVEDLRRSREHVLRADRLGTLGTLAAGLAHEINNPLVSIHTFLSMAPTKRHEQDEEFWGDYHELAAKEVDRIRRLVDTMRRLGRGGGEGAPSTVFDPGELAQEVVTLLHREADRSGVELNLERAPETPKLCAIRDQIHQVFLNLLLNAIHVTPRGGEVRLRTGPADAGQGLRVDISDCGEGIPEEHLERIFDPFFTTKGPDQGTGLGLMICHRVVADHGGSIEVRSRPGEGATFSVLLPAAEAPRTPLA